MKAVAKKKNNSSTRKDGTSYSYILVRESVSEAFRFLPGLRTGWSMCSSHRSTQRKSIVLGDGRDEGKHGRVYAPY